MKHSAITKIGIKELKAALATHPSLTDVSLSGKYSYQSFCNLVQEREMEKEKTMRLQQMRQEEVKMLSKAVSMIPNSNLALTEVENRWEIVKEPEAFGVPYQYKSETFEHGNLAMALSNKIEKLLKSDPGKSLYFLQNLEIQRIEGNTESSYAITLANSIGWEIKK